MSVPSRGALSSNAPAMKAVAITPNDSTDLSATGIRSIYVGGTGDVSVIGINDVTNSGAGTAVVLSAVPAGSVIPIAPKRVRATGTTATAIVGLI